MYSQNSQMFRLWVTRKPSDLEKNPPLGFADQFLILSEEVLKHSESFKKLDTDNLNNKQAFAMMDDRFEKLESTVGELSSVVKSYDLSSSSDLHVHTEVGKTIGGD